MWIADVTRHEEVYLGFSSSDDPQHHLNFVPELKVLLFRVTNSPKAILPQSQRGWNSSADPQPLENSKIYSAANT